MSGAGHCGTCRFFEVRNAMEADLARIARDEKECAPGEYTFRGQRKLGCVGGAVRGACLRWKEVPLPHPTVDSTFGCRLYQPGGPVVRGSLEAQQSAGSANRATSSDGEGAMGNGAVLAVIVAGAITLAAAYGDRLAFWRRR